jgi:hypothetical protein
MSTTTTQNLNHLNSPVIPFQAETPEEETTAKVIRMMLKFEVLRVQLESGQLPLTEDERFAMRQEASSLRVLGFRAQRTAVEAGIPVTYDDDLLRREGTRIAYLLARSATDQAKLIEEEVITISVNKALYNIDEDRITIDLASLAA